MGGGQPWTERQNWRRWNTRPENITIELKIQHLSYCFRISYEGLRLFKQENLLYVWEV